MLLAPLQRVRRWEVWKLPLRARLLVLLVIGSGAAVLIQALLLAPHPSPEEWIIGVLLLLTWLTHLEATLPHERARQVYAVQSRNNSRHDLSNVWCFAIVLALPLGGALVVATVGGIYMRLRNDMGLGYRFLYARAATLLGIAAAAVVLGLGGVEFGAEVPSLTDLTVLLAAHAVFLLLGSCGLVSLAMHVVAKVPLRDTMNRNELLLELATLGIGTVLGIVVLGPTPWIAVFLWPVLILLNTAVGAEEREHAHDHDPATGLLTPTAWYLAARRRIRRAARRHSSAGITVLRIDGLDPVLDTHGPDVVDSIVSTIARRAAHALPSGALASRTDTTELTVLVADPAQLTDTAHTLAAATTTEDTEDTEPNALPPVSARVGTATFPQNGITLEELLTTAQHIIRHRARRR